MIDPPLYLTTCQSVNTEGVCQELAGYLTARGVPAEFENGLACAERYRRFARGELAIAWVCAWPAAEMLISEDPAVELLAAPIMKSTHYANECQYFSYLIVPKNTPFRRLADLENGSLAVNEIDSHSGCRIVRYALAHRGLTGRFFDKVILTGSHLDSIRAVQEGLAQTAAIDSTLFDWLAAFQPEKVAGLRIIETFGPTPGPPLMIHKSVPPAQRQHIRHLLKNMHRTPAGRQILAGGLFARLAGPSAFDPSAVHQMTPWVDRVQLFEI